LLADLGRLVVDQQITDAQARQRLAELVALNEQHRPPSKSQIARDRLIEAIRPVRGLLRELVKQPWQASGEHPVTKAITALRDLYGTPGTRSARSHQAPVPDRSGAMRSLALIASGRWR